MKSSIKYKIGSKIPASRFLDLELQVETGDQSTITLALPTWRPGRYELANFAKFIRGFKVFDVDKKELSFKKQSAHIWLINCNQQQTITIAYQYYTIALNAGSSWVDNNQLYINPVNCLMYVLGREKEPYEVKFDVPADYQIATGLSTNRSNTFTAKDFDELADCPAICSPSLQHKTYQVKGTVFNIWFQGDLNPNWEKLIPNFIAFTKSQLESMGSFPFTEYHFLFQILPHKAYHGVEHLNSTVISLGPETEVMESTLYEELLGVSSHELFHAWNVKSIRPSDMLPYDFTKENYTEMGYLTEGITTYLGDLFLKKSAVFNLNRYLQEVQKLLDRHALNYGKFNYSVCESSFDTWLDGYEMGIPNRKVSIYNEGALLALCVDVMLIHNTGGKSNLESVMKALFEDYACKGMGITEAVFIHTIKRYGGLEIENIFENYYHKASDYFDLLKITFEKVGYELKKENHDNQLAHLFGCQTDKKGKVVLIAPGSPAYLKGINVGDEIMRVNDVKFPEFDPKQTNNLAKETNEQAQSVKIEVKKIMGKKTTIMSPDQGEYFQKYALCRTQKTNQKQEQNHYNWLNQ